MTEGVLQPTERTKLFDQQYAELLALIESLKGTELVVSDVNLSEQIETLEGLLSEYKATFEAIHLNVQKRGYGQYGLVGEIDAARKQLKSKLAAMPQDSSLTEAIANLDIAHVNYLYTQAPRYLDQIEDQLGYPNTQVALGSGSQQYKDEYLEISEHYVTAFTELVELDDLIGRTESEGLIGQLSTTSNAVNDSVDTFQVALRSKLNNQIRSVVRTLGVIVVIIVIVGILFSIFISSIISKPLLNLNQMLNDISEGEGDLTRQLEVKSKEEIGILAKLFNQFVEKIRAVVLQVKQSAQTVLDYTEEIHDAVHQANESIENVSSEVGTMIGALQNNAGVVEETTARIEELSSNAHMISKEAQAVADDSRAVLSASKDGVEKLKTVVSRVEQVQASSAEMSNMIETLRGSSEEIVGIVGLINAIAEQTSLLALNASIEAARAGEHGRGFSVVAEEVRKLADESKNSAFKINDIIAQISKDIANVGNTMNKEKNLVDASASEAHETNRNFDRILALIEAIDYKIERISKGADQQSIISEEMAHAIDELSQIMQSNVESSERIGENVENQVATFEQVGASITELRNMAAVLETETNKFKV